MWSGYLIIPRIMSYFSHHLHTISRFTSWSSFQSRVVKRPPPCISLKFLTCNSNLMKKLFTCNLIHRYKILHMPTQHSCWTKSCMNHSIIIPMMTKQNLHQIWIMMAELLVRWPPGWCFKNDYELVNVGALKLPPVQKLHIFNVWVRYFV